ncbi:hypothetical protein [Silvanigrella aquatica]|uniref:Lipoprotein n=1 Tax=Silvanigrella aquatica TaxID=1915309 RepID=A0A1L4D0G6_9BACT|nr:hypothetical protein [Silvanigrella aquatica]APJ03696.1 hypothetical protein AXG55_07165 [Silvanigrella aquatica]
MNKIITLTLFFILFLPSIFSCGNSSKERTSQNSFYYIVTEVITPNNQSYTFSSDVNEIYSKNNDYNVVIMDSTNQSQVFIACDSLECNANQLENLKIMESNSFVKLIAKLGYPNKITTVADENGFRYNAVLISENSESSKLKKVITKNNSPLSSTSNKYYF